MITSHNKKLKVIPLGGLGEIGKNMMAIEYDSQILIIDAGIAFPSEIKPVSSFGVSDTSYLNDRKNMILGVLITHGHDDHIGGLPHLLNEYNVPVYSSRLTREFIKFKLGNKHKVDLRTINFYESYSLGCFEFEFFPVCHSIPDAAGIAIKSPVGLLVHTGDFKFDDKPTLGSPLDLEYLSNLSSNTNLILCSDSTYAEKAGFTDSEATLEEKLSQIISQSEGRVLIATFSSLLSRIQQIITISSAIGRKVSVVGRSMNRNLKVALDLGYVTDPQNTVIPLRDSKKLPNHKVLLITTGAQGEGSSAMGLISRGEHSDVSIKNGDTIVISSSPIPGNEVKYSHMINNLFRQGGQVIYQNISLVHVHGHGSREDLKRMIKLVKPKYFIPIHGETRHLVAHANIAEKNGVNRKNIFMIEDGDTVEFTGSEATLGSKVHSGTIYIDSSGTPKPQ